ncbi:MAG: hydrogenase formation protein HypD [Candidatus Omnitrophota bacterium]
MKYIDEFRNPRLVKRLAANISGSNPGVKINIMEVCGTHTQNFYRFGLPGLLPGNIRLISGPGCPVCVSPQGYIDSAIALAKNKDLIIATFGDMLRIPGTSSSLEREKARLGNVRVAYSPLDALAIAENNPDKQIVFLAVGFETTAPAIALTVLEAKRKKLKNLSFFSSLKLIPPAMRHLLSDKRLKIDGFLCPGHVSAVIGTRGYEFIPKQYKIPCCVAGFEPVDILEAILIIIGQIILHKACVANQYARVVTESGNILAQGVINRVFEPGDSNWRGFGVIPDSGLELRKEFSAFDAKRIFSISGKTARTRIAGKCRCADVLKGIISPDACVLFAKACNPDNPIGPCMVSSEGACNAYYKFR